MDPSIVYGGHNVSVARKINYLGVQIDTKLNFRSHLFKAISRARKATVALARIMPNVGGPKQSKRRLLSSVVNSKLMYAAPVWAKVVGGVARNREMLSQTALRVARYYRTVSDMATMVIANMSSGHLLTDERSRVGVRRRATGIMSPAFKHEISNKERAETMSRWQHLWSGSAEGHGTKRLLSNVIRWSRRLNRLSVSFQLA